jgi:hypothetical protein
VRVVSAFVHTIHSKLAASENNAQHGGADG